LALSHGLGETPQLLVLAHPVSTTNRCAADISCQRSSDVFHC
jgi:hypothetical protein